MQHSISSGLLVVFFSMVTPAIAQPVTEGVISNLEIHYGTACEPEITEVVMNIPIRYISHFPHKQSDQVRIKMTPLSARPLDALELNQRESRTTPLGKGGLLQEATFESDLSGGPFLSLYFRETTNFQIVQGSDLRSIWIIATPSKPTQDSACSHTSADEQ